MHSAVEHHPPSLPPFLSIPPLALMTLMLVRHVQAHGWWIHHKEKIYLFRLGMHTTHPKSQFVWAETGPTHSLMGYAAVRMSSYQSFPCSFACRFLSLSWPVYWHHQLNATSSNICSAKHRHPGRCWGKVFKLNSKVVWKNITAR